MIADYHDSSLICNLYGGVYKTLLKPLDNGQVEGNISLSDAKVFAECEKEKDQK